MAMFRVESGKYDFVVIGAGIVGLTVAHELRSRYPDARIAVIEKEEDVGKHASGRNSGVLHSGIYYPNDTVKAKVCSEGSRRMLEFAIKEGIPYSQKGKVIVATDEKQRASLFRLLENAKQNEIKAEYVDTKQLTELEPFASKENFGAIYCPSTAVIDSNAIVNRLNEVLVTQGVDFYYGACMFHPESSDRIFTSKGVFEYSYLYNCAGAYADKIAKAFGVAGNYELIPFKGIYWKLANNINYKVRSNIYPVPNPSLPFLGVHLTRVINNEVYVGPTAIPAFSRENYGLLRGIDLSEAINILPVLMELFVRNKNNFRKMAYMEFSKYNKNKFLNEVKKLMPSLRLEDLVPTLKSGIRPQLINRNSGELQMDFVFEATHNSTHVLNAISPAFTSSFEFARYIVDHRIHS